MKQNRFRSPILWAAVLAQLVIILPLFINPDIVEKINKAVLALIEIATILGILNNPSDKRRI